MRVDRICIRLFFSMSDSSVKPGVLSRPESFRDRDRDEDLKRIARFAAANMPKTFR